MTEISQVNQSISVIIPTLNQTKTLPIALKTIQSAIDTEVIVVDG